MSRENDIYTVLHATGVESLYLTGGLYKYEDLGPDGISRIETPSAFDSDGYLKPCGLIKQRSAVNTGDLSDHDYALISLREVIELYLYQDKNYDRIDGAKNYINSRLMGSVFSGTFEIELANVIDRQRDNGALKGSSLIRMDWVIVSVDFDIPI